MSEKSFAATAACLLALLLGTCGTMYWMAGQLADVAKKPAPIVSHVDTIAQSESVPDDYRLWQASAIDPLEACWDSGASTAAVARLRLGSYNLENFSDGTGDGEARTEEAAHRQAAAAAALIERIDPDILVIQEVENARALQWLNEAFARSYPLGYLTHFDNPNHTTKLNIAVLSRIALNGVSEIDFGPLQGANLPPRGVLRFAAPVGRTREILVYGVHLKSNYGSLEKNVAKRVKALLVVAEDARRMQADAPAFREVVVIGDMNADPDNVAFAADDSLSPLHGFHDLWRSRRLLERTTIPTRHGDPHRTFPPAAFDRVIVSEDLVKAPWIVGPPHALAAGVDTADVDALPGGDDGHVSDHYPVFVDLVR